MTLQTPDEQWVAAVERARAHGVTIHDGDVLTHPYVEDDRGIPLRFDPATTVGDHETAANGADTPAQTRAAHRLLAGVRDALDHADRLPAYAKDVRGLTSIDSEPTLNERALARRLDALRRTHVVRAMNDLGLYASPARIDQVFAWQDEDWRRAQQTPAYDGPF